MRYRRAFIPGGSFFFTVVTEQRRPLLASADAVGVLRAAFRAVRASRPFDVDAIVVLPDHLHCIWTLPPGDADFATRWRLIKTWFTKHCDPAIRTEANRVRTAKREQAVWQHRYWEHTLRDEVDVIRHVEYIHFNPVKHGLVSSAFEWPHSSFRRYVKAGLYPADWGQGAMDFEGVGQE
ncbi:transposase [Candidatus Methylomirabilis sp.]|uniref:REP-associated tyrosine transposase n=1 Tax=Candidatus Methylomirabilis sp. TaxID=2032687 RepID=UPI0030765F75